MNGQVTWKYWEHGAHLPCQCEPTEQSCWEKTVWCGCGNGEAGDSRHASSGQFNTLQVHGERVEGLIGLRRWAHLTETNYNLIPV